MIVAAETSRAHEIRQRPGRRRWLWRDPTDHRPHLVKGNVSEAGVVAKLFSAGASATERRSLRVVLADDHVVVRQGLKWLLEREGFAVVGEASNGVEAVRLTRHFRPEVAILDFDMPLMNGIDAVTEIVRHSPRTRTILLTADTGHQHLAEALRAGSRGFVLKNHGVAHLIRAIDEVTRGGVYVSPSVSTTVAPASLAKTDFPLDRLTRRERQVLQLIAEGKKTKEIAALLGVKIKTAETHRTRIMRRVNIHETANLVRYAIRGGLTRL